MKLKLTFLVCFLLMGVFAIGQKTITGTIKDASGEAVIGASIVIDGTATGTATDFDGTFSLDVPSDDAVLVISYTGFKEMRVTVGSQSTFDLVMQEDVAVLDAVVVSALGFTQKKDEVGSTSSTVAAADITRNGENTLLASLGGRAAGVQINRSNGDPGAGATIRIRGANTITGSSNPLIILDGIPISNSTIYGGGNNVTGGRTGGTSQQSRLNDINPADIESVQILKGASAAALWGSRAANGVLVITTKSGAAGKPKISFTSSYSIDEVSERYDLQDTWGQGRAGVYSPTLAEAWGDYIPDRSGGADVVDQSGEFFEAANGNRYYPIEEKNSRETFLDENWDSGFQTGGFWQNDLTISGGSDKATYFFSLGRMEQEGIIQESFYDRTNLRLNNKFFLTDWLTVSSKAGYTRSASNRIQQSSNTAGLLLGLLRTPPDFDNRDYIGTYFDDDGVAFTNRHRAYRRYLGNNQNPIYNSPGWTVNEQDATSDVGRFLMSIETNIIPTSWLQITLRGGVDSYEDKRDYFFPIGSGGDRNVGIYAEDVINEQEINFDAIARANFQLNSDIGLNATVGWNINDRERRINFSQITGFLVNSRKQTTDLNTSATASTVSNTERFIRSNRGYGILAFDAYDQLFVSFSGSVEAASTIDGTFFYPAADVAWQFTKTLVPTTNFLSFGKLRLSYGQVGVQPQAHRFQTLAEGGFSYSSYSDPIEVGLFGGGFRLDDDQGNPNLQPEIKTEFEVGFDFRFFREKLSFSATYYQNEIEDILLPIDLTPSSGFDTRYANAGSMENVGFEAEIDWSAINGDDFGLGFFANFNANENTVTSLQGAESIILAGGSVSSRAVQGEPLGVLFGTGSLTNPDGSFDLNEDGFPQITPNPIALGDPNPDWRGGVGFRVRWKNFNLDALLEHSQGGVFSPRTLWVLNRFGTTAETANLIESTPTDLVNYAGDIIPAGSRVRGNIRNFGAGDVLLDESWYRTGIGGGFGDNQAYNFSLADATFTRLREVSLSYSLNSNWVKEKLKLSTINFKVTGRNLFLINDIEGIDPEINQSGVTNGLGLDYFTNPTTRSFLFTISVNY
ncbi:MAG: SusC/RagA family TonB-linked outer membrane protein [Bacteroidota bacterium]